MMRRTLLAALGLLLCANAHATDYNSNTITLYQADGNPTLYFLDRYKFDKPMIVYEPDSGVTAKNQLIVFLHGHSATSGPSGNDVLAHAASLGFHGVSLDYDYGWDPDGIDNGPRYVCGCYTDCYSQFHYLIVNGNVSYAGLPPSHYPVKDRIKSIVAYMNQTRPNRGWDQYLNGGNIVWSQIVLAGHSRGTSLVTHLAKFNQVARVVTFAGDHDQLINGMPDKTYGDGQPGSPPTSYGYGGGTACTYPAYDSNFSPAYLTDNSWTGTAPNNHVWATQRAQCGASQSGGCQYSFSNEGDTVAPYLKHFVDSNNHELSWGTAINLTTLGFENLPGGHALTGNHTSKERTGWETNSPHWLTPGVTINAAGVVTNNGDLCGVGDPHDNPISGSCITTEATNLQKKVWTYMLTNPN